MSTSMSEEEKLSYAEESDKTKKVRRKLLEHFNQIDSMVTQQALNRKISEIHRWISRHAVQRVALSSKTISLFDENQHAADVSQKVALLASHLKNQFDVSVKSVQESESVVLPNLP